MERFQAVPVIGRAVSRRTRLGVHLLVGHDSLATLGVQSEGIRHWFSNVTKTQPLSLAKGRFALPHLRFSPSLSKNFATPSPQTNENKIDLRNVYYLIPFSNAETFGANSDGASERSN